MAKCKDWSADPKMWLILFVVGGVATAVATAYVTRAMNIENATLKAKLATAGA